MAFLLKFLLLIVGIAGGTAFIKYNFQLTQLFGHNYYAEKYLGDGGTYLMWKLLGALVIVITVIYVF
jgi:hypothetical protein